MRDALQQSVTEIAWLKGATVKSIRKVRGSVGLEDDSCIEITFELKPHTAGVTLIDENDKTVLVQKIQVWCDPEGNGPGFLATV